MSRTLTIYPVYNPWDEEQEHPTFVGSDSLEYFSSHVIDEPVTVDVNHIPLQLFQTKAHMARLSEAEKKVQKQFNDLEKAKEELAKLQCITHQPKSSDPIDDDIPF